MSTHHEVHQHYGHEEEEDEEQRVDVGLEELGHLSNEVVTELYLAQSHHKDVQHRRLDVVEHRLQTRSKSKDFTIAAVEFLRALGSQS